MSIVLMFAADQVPRHTRYMLQGYPFEIFDPDLTYRDSTVFLYDMYGPYQEYIKKHLDQGHRVIYDAKNEHYVNPSKRWVLDEFVAHPDQGMFLISGHEPQTIPGVAIVATPYWYWVLDQPRLQSIGLDQYQPSPTRKKKFFMSLGKSRVHRDYLYDNLGDLLQDSVHSYLSRGISLSNDWNEGMGGAFDRYVNTEWLDTTCFTLAVETYIADYIDGTDVAYGFSITQNDHLFLCEKTYKPMACKHPLLMVSTQGNLAYLRNQGFETFPELWDESYDGITDWQTRIDCIIQIVRDFDPQSLDNPVVQQKLLYNSARFFDKDLRTHLLNSTMINPLLEFVNA